MAQITIYMDDDTANVMRAAAEAAGLSVSRWLSDLVRARTATAWPAEFLALEGAWEEYGPEFDEPMGEDVPRESL